MVSNRPKVYLFSWIGPVGGAATKNLHWIRLFHKLFDLTMVPLDDRFLGQSEATHYLDRLGIKYQSIESLPKRIEGTVLAVCEPTFFSSGLADTVKERGAKVVWSNEMTWGFDGEAEAIRKGTVDRVIYVSEFQRKLLSTVHTANTDYRIIENYIDEGDFKYLERRRPARTVGRLSRPDPDKYSPDFPVFYKELMLKNARYRIMAWDDRLAKIFSWHSFGPEWELLEPGEILAWDFLFSLDLFVYKLGHLVKESWGRAVVEAMLTGCPVLVPSGHYFDQILVHGESGFICDTFADYATYANALWDDSALRLSIGKAAATYAREMHCNKEKQRELWSEALSL